MPAPSDPTPSKPINGGADVFLTYGRKMLEGDFIAKLAGALPGLSK
ncbi:hypothetical protein LP417_24915 [Polaromonas sp. P1-6]|nr:hypothetical protein LP417_24915 [Polaromonas sp. P1-6]